MSQQHKQGRPQGGQHGGYEEGRRPSQGGHGEERGRSAAGSNYGDVGSPRGGDNDYRGSYGYGSQEPWGGDGQGNPPRDWDYDAGSGRRETRDPGNYGRQDYGNHGGGGLRRPQDDTRTGAYGLDMGPPRGYGHPTSPEQAGSSGSTSAGSTSSSSKSSK